jgi:hypothetical protein
MRWDEMGLEALRSMEKRLDDGGERKLREPRLRGDVSVLVVNTGLAFELCREGSRREKKTAKRNWYYAREESLRDPHHYLSLELELNIPMIRYPITSRIIFYWKSPSHDTTPPPTTISPPTLSARPTLLLQPPLLRNPLPSLLLHPLTPHHSSDRFLHRPQNRALSRLRIRL